jgi:hypothetical protein
MGEDFYCILKLVSGEEILSHIMVDDEDGDPIIILQKPLVVKIFSNQGVQYIKVKPWIELSDDDIFIIKLDKVITMTETTDEKLIELYDNFIVEDSIKSYSSGVVKPSSKMGYVSSVEETRKRLERLFKEP